MSQASGPTDTELVSTHTFKEASLNAVMADVSDTVDTVDTLDTLDISDMADLAISVDTADMVTLATESRNQFGLPQVELYMEKLRLTSLNY